MECWHCSNFVAAREWWAMKLNLYVFHTWTANWTNFHWRIECEPWHGAYLSFELLKMIWITSWATHEFCWMQAVRSLKSSSSLHSLQDICWVLFRYSLLWMRRGAEEDLHIWIFHHHHLFHPIFSVGLSFFLPSLLSSCISRINAARGALMVAESKTNRSFCMNK